jgi:hypothetical protein
MRDDTGFAVGVAVILAAAVFGALFVPPFLYWMGLLS